MTDRFVIANLSVMTVLTVSEAATRLGVSTRQVQHLVARGELRQVARGVIDRASIERWLAVRTGTHTRAWAEATAWGAVALLSGVPADWMGQSQRSRLKARLRSLAAPDLVERARARAVVGHYSGHASTGDRLRSELVSTASSAALLGLADSDGGTDGYLSTAHLADLVRTHGLTRNDEGRYTLRATATDLAIVAELAERAPVLAALDLAESLDVRERRAGLDALASALERFDA